MKKKIVMGIAAITTIMFLGSGLSFAGNGAGKGKRNGTGDRNRDGSCQSVMTVEDEGMTLAADRARKRDRKKDGTCQSMMTVEDDAMTLAADRVRDKKKDRSC